MKYLWRCVIPVGIFLLGGCVSNQRSVEQRLLAAGFIQRPAVTAGQEQELKTLPPNRIILQSYGQKLTYVYADPIYCKCLYVGDSQAYGKFQYLTVLQQRADEEMAAANMNFMAATSYPWYGYGYPYYYGYPSTYWGAGYYSPGWYRGYHGWYGQYGYGGFRGGGGGFGGGYGGFHGGGGGFHGGGGGFRR